MFHRTREDWRALPELISEAGYGVIILLISSATCGPSGVIVLKRPILPVFLIFPFLLAIRGTCANGAILDIQAALGKEDIRYNANGVYATSDGYTYLALSIDEEGKDLSGALCTISLADPAKPVIVSVIPTPTEARRVFVEGDRVFLVERERVSIYNRKDPAAPKPTGVIPVAATNIFVRGGLIYLVGEGSSGDRVVGRLQIYDLMGEHSRLLGKVDLPEPAFGLCVEGKYAFVADGWKGLVLVNIADPTRPAVTAVVKTRGFTGGIAVQGKYAYLAQADFAIGGAYFGLLQIVDLTDPKRPVLRGSVITTQFGAMGPGEVVDVVVDQNRVYLADMDGLHTIDVAEPDKPRIISTVPIKGMAIPGGLSVRGGKVYITYCFVDTSPSGGTTWSYRLQIMGLAE